MKIFLKKILLMLVFIIVSMTTTHAAYYQSIYPTLSDWAQALICNVPEYSEQDYGEGITCLPYNEFENSLTNFIIRFQVRSNHKTFWLGEEALDAHLFDCTKNFDLKKSRHCINGSDIYSAFVQKMIIPAGSNICFIGDLHGSAHSLMRNMLRLAAKGWLRNDFSLTDKNRYIIFTGDIVDRGGSGVEALYTILRLKLANWDNVIILRGNHESVTLSQQGGFLGEIQKKYAGKIDRIWFKRIKRFYELLPFALFLGCGQGDTKHFVLCCHGGIEPGFDPEELLNDKSSRKFQIISSQHVIPCVEHEITKHDNYSGFNWSDFCQDNGNKITCNYTRGAGYLADVQATKEFLKQHNIKAFFRGHQDMAFGLKMFFASAQERDEKITELHEQGETFKTCLNLDVEDEAPQGPYHWRYVVHSNNQHAIPVANYAPIYTFTSAAEGRGLQFDCFGIVKTANVYEYWTMEPHEYDLEAVSFFNAVARSSIDGSQEGDLQPFYSHLSLLQEEKNIAIKFCSDKNQSGLDQNIIDYLQNNAHENLQQQNNNAQQNNSVKRKLETFLQESNDSGHPEALEEKKLKIDE